MAPPTALNAMKPWKRSLSSHEVVLALLVAAEWSLFAVTGSRFATLENTFDIVRHSAELALLAVGMTGVILAGGIDLSVGSLLGLCAIVLGKLWRDAGVPLPWAILASLILGAIGGGFNAVLIDRVRMPALIVTLGTYSLYRGLAEAITHGVDTYTNFPAWFLSVGQERWLGIPAQLPVVIGVIVAFWVAIHRFVYGRTLRAIGLSPEGARYAGLAVSRTRALTYVLSGLVAALGAILYTARLGQAKADAGTGYELAAITAVVLGGTSIFGGKGTVHGTLLGVAALAILDNGLVHARWPREAGGVLTGALLVIALIAGSAPRLWHERRQGPFSFSPPQTPKS